MALQELRKEINGRKVFAKQWNAKKGLAMSIKLLNTCQHLAIPFIEGNADFDDVLRLMAQVDHDRLTPIMLEFIYCARTVDKSGQPIEIDSSNVDLIYEEKLIDLVLVFKEIAELQFKDFFVQGRARLPRRK